MNHFVARITNLSGARARQVRKLLVLTMICPATRQGCIAAKASIVPVREMNCRREHALLRSNRTL
jgi:hypothetical protein